ncbi:MAG: CPBP family intramembrane metalloprotease [Deltaproteobacteria bacterium]|nr:CPBP family intramembrane metalloprotease [Deltaproteobacteria bacterium]
MFRFARWVIHALFIDRWREIEAESDTRSRDLDRRPFVILVASAILLTLVRFWGNRQTLNSVFGIDPDGPFAILNGEILWVATIFVGFFIVPALILKLMGEPVLDYGLRSRGFAKHVKVYVILYLVVLPFIIVASTSPRFLETYPFYRLAGRSAFDFLVFEAFYALQFLAVEFFFRGFMLFGLKARFGAHAIFVTIIPYAMIHFQKPFAEALGATLAGLALGTLALWTRSIYCGALVHISVAVTMDVFAILRLR